MDYNDFCVLALASVGIMILMLGILEKFDDSIVIWIMAIISIIAALAMLTLNIFIEEPNEENCSKKEVLESQKIEAILYSDTAPVKDGVFREAATKDYDIYKGVITYTSDKSLDKTYQRIRYYDSFFYNDDVVIYLYDSSKALTNDK